MKTPKNHPHKNSTELIDPKKTSTREHLKNLKDEHQNRIEEESDIISGAKKGIDNSIYLSLGLMMLESDKNAGIIDEITLIIREHLKPIKNEETRKIEEDKILIMAQKSEEHIFAILPSLEDIQGDLEIPLDAKIKELMKPIIPDILFLYEYRMGHKSTQRLMELLQSEKNERAKIIISYKLDTDTKKYYLKKITLTEKI